MVTSYYIMKMNKKAISMEEYYSGLHDMPLPAFSKNLKRITRGVCRVCLQDGDIPITSATNPNKMIRALNIFGKIEFDEDDENVAFLCYTCNKFLKSAILFRKVAHRTNETLRQLFLKQSPDLHNSNDYLETVEDDTSHQVYDKVFECNNKPEVDGGKVQCPLCNQVLSESHYKKHISEHHDPSPTDENSMKQELADDSNKFKCPICAKLMCKSFYKVHLELHNLNPIEAESYYLEQELKYNGTKVQCPMCQQFLSKLSYKTHLQQHNPNRFKKPLEQHRTNPLPDHLRDHEYLAIYEEFGEQETFEGNLNQINPTEVQEEDVSKVVCSVCKKLICKSTYKNHVEEHNLKHLNQKIERDNHIQPKIVIKDQSIICPICKKVFKEKYYKKHVELHNPDPSVQFVCEICGKSFKTKPVYQSHKFRHGNRYYRCKLCPYIGRYKERLTMHMRVHTGDLKYLCTQCPARYISRGSLSDHIKLKHTEPQYKCDSCDKAFYNNLNLQRHIDVAHLGIRNHECNICGSAFSYRKYMLKHQRVVHKRANLKPIFSKATYKHITNIM